MSIFRLALMPGVTLIFGGSYMPKTVYDRQTFGRVPYAKMPDGAVHFFISDDKRLRVPASSVAYVVEDDVTGSEVTPPDRAWALESVTFKTAISIGGRHVSLNFWSADKYPDVQCRESERGIELVVFGGGNTIVPMHSVATIRDKRIAPPTIPPPPADSWPVDEHTPTMPPTKRSTKTEATSSGSRGRH